MCLQNVKLTCEKEKRKRSLNSEGAQGCQLDSLYDIDKWP